MTVYAVVASAPSPTLSAAIEAQYPGDNKFVLGPELWLISSAAPKLTQTISQELGVTSGGVGVSAVIFQVSGPAWGWHNKSLWDWLRVTGVN